VQGIGKRFVYIIRSDSDPNRHYVGVTGDPDSRLRWHNVGPSGHTVSHRPWSFVVVIEFPTQREALRFERYLKSGSGRAFARRHFAAAIE
jgi:predicted GIY-YIG superfamily endonuclease